MLGLVQQALLVVLGLLVFRRLGMTAVLVDVDVTFTSPAGVEVRLRGRNRIDFLGDVLRIDNVASSAAARAEFAGARLVRYALLEDLARAREAGVITDVASAWRMRLVS